MPDLDVILNDVQTLDVDLRDNLGLDIAIGQTFATKDHTVLLNRDAADQHPISAITGLSGSLTQLQNNIDNLVPANALHADSADFAASAGKAVKLYYGQIASDSTSTDLKATISGITALEDGVVILLKNGVVSSASGCTLNVNGLGAKRIHYSMAADTAITTVFNVNYTALLYYDSARNSGDGAWVFYYGYYTSSNTIGYQIRAQYRMLKAKSKFYRYRLLFESPDGTKYIPANTSSSTNGTSARTVNQDAFNPFGRICYYANTSAVNQDAAPGASYLWDQYTLVLGYSFNTGNQTLTTGKQVWLECVPQSDGSVQLLSPDPIVQALPAADTGHVYILLGYAYDTTHIELYYDHPVQYVKNGRLRVWTGEDIS